MRQEDAQFVATLARCLPKRIGAGHAARIANRLQRLARLADRNALNLCNVPNWKDNRENIREKIEELKKEYRLDWKIEPGGDPRGYCLHVYFPDGSYNTMGGKEDGYGVPC